MHGFECTGNFICRANIFRETHSKTRRRGAEKDGADKDGGDGRGGADEMRVFRRTPFFPEVAIVIWPAHH